MHPTPLSCVTPILCIVQHLSRKAVVYLKEVDQIPSDSGEEVGVFRNHLPLSSRAVPLSNRETGSKIELKIK